MRLGLLCLFLKLFCKESIISLLTLMAAAFIITPFLKQEVAYPDAVLFTIGFLLVFISPVVFLKMLQDTEDMKKGVLTANNVKELIKFSLGLKNFVFLLALMLWLLFLTAVAGAAGVYGIGIIIFFIDASVLSFLIIFTGMILSTRKVKKSILSILLFAVITFIFAPLCIIIFAKIISLIA